MKGAKEMFEEYCEIEREQDDCFVEFMEHQEAEELHSTVRHCAGCNHNWNRLDVSDSEGDEQYEFCPVCRTDEFIGSYSAGEIFSLNPITGEIINVRTGMPETEPVRFIPEVVKPMKPFDPIAYDENNERMESSEDKAIAAYQKAYDAGGQAAGEKAYQKALKNN